MITGKDSANKQQANSHQLAESNKDYSSTIISSTRIMLGTNYESRLNDIMSLKLGINHLHIDSEQVVGL